MEEIARVYAEALFESAEEKDKLDDIREQLAEFADAVRDDRDLQQFLFSPYFSTQEKVDGLENAISGADEEFVNFLELLADDWSHGVEAAVDIALLGRYYERIADHAVSLARRVVYLVTGETVTTVDHL